MRCEICGGDHKDEGYFGNYQSLKECRDNLKRQIEAVRLVVDLIDGLQENGSSLTMNYGEDTDCWEVSFIAEGERFNSSRSSLSAALLHVKKEAIAFAEITKNEV